MADEHGQAERDLTVVSLPARIDISNARCVGDDLIAVFDSGVTVVIADLTGTAQCSVAGVHELALAHERATARNIELRLAIPPGEALRVFALTGHDRWLPIYPSMTAALMGRAHKADSLDSGPLEARCVQQEMAVAPAVFGAVALVNDV